MMGLRKPLKGVWIVVRGFHHGGVFTFQSIRRPSKCPPRMPVEIYAQLILLMDPLGS